MAVTPLIADKIRESIKSECGEKCSVLNVEDLNQLVEQIHSKEKPIKAD